MRAGDAVVRELLTDWFPSSTAVLRALDQLPEPAGGLRRINTIWINGRSLHVINFPAREVGTVNVPLFPLAVRSQNECALASANQYTNLAHSLTLPDLSVQLLLPLRNCNVRSEERRVGKEC